MHHQRRVLLHALRDRSLFQRVTLPEFASQLTLILTTGRHHLIGAINRRLVAARWNAHKYAMMMMMMMRSRAAIIQ